MNPNEAIPALRSNNLALAFQDVITVVLRVRYRTQRVADAASFRENIRKMIATGAQEVRRLGYSDSASQMSLYAIVGFLDESVLNSQDPVFQDWPRRPLQEEMFGGSFAGEYFFRHVSDMLNQPETAELADVLELHAICLLLGYRGKFAFGDNGEIPNILRAIREKIARIRGPIYLCRVAPPPALAAIRAGDAWFRRLVVMTALIAVVCLLAFAGYWYLLGEGLNAVQVQVGSVTPLFHPGVSILSASAMIVGGIAR
jgi:type VI secretion system protein ImpK